ncbi:hypothetical protein [Zhongshania sp.]|uniref:hypothetical protein n=1 Tax=Zhongshania sp. TaxID=1971902 RepID=UPI003569D027
MKYLLPIIIAISSVALSACKGSGSPYAASSTAAQDICLDCGTPRQLVNLPQLENSLFTSNGRLFVSGQSNLYEIHRDGQDYRADALLPDGSGCSGLTEDKGTLYALCSGSGGPTDFSGLYTMSLDDPLATPEFSFALSGMTLPNGIVATASGLYVTDGPVAVEPKIVHLAIDPTDPTLVLSQSTWLATLPDFPNGIVHTGTSLYVTHYRPGFGGQVTQVAINSDGSPGTPENIAPRGIMDDLTVVGDTLIVTDWQDGSLFQIDLEGNLLQETANNIFAQPSSVIIAGPPLFDQVAILVTERYTGDGLWILE